jgi:hypothetical protein
MEMENEMQQETLQLLAQYYKISTSDIPTQRIKSEWKTENKYGFLVGVAKHSLDFHQIELNGLLITNQFESKECSFIESMFDYYIRPFHKSYIGSECKTTPTPSRRTSRANSTEDLDYEPEERESKHQDLIKAVVKRDGVCLFCWTSLLCEGAHIIAQKNVPFAQDVPSILSRAGLGQKHQVQNGLLLCVFCHGLFDRLKRYVDVVDDKLVLKVVNETNDKTSEKHQEWKRVVRDLRISRYGREEDWERVDYRKAVESNGEMALYFLQDDLAKKPNRTALEFHKAACLIWRMAGGAEPEEEYCSDDDELKPVDTAALKIRFGVQDSVETLV